MHYRKLGKTDLTVSEVGFGAWGIGGPAMAGDIPIGWGNVDDSESLSAIKEAVNKGINFFDTADFYGVGHSEELLGNFFFKNWEGIVLATKVGHKLNSDQSISLDYSKKHIINACDQSLKRLKKEVIDLYQLHSAKLVHLKEGECIEAMEQLTKEGKIRYWGISLNTFNPEPEADFFFQNNIGFSLQLVFNVINQHTLEYVIPQANKKGYGIIARMPLQFGLLSRKFSKHTKFDKDDHRSFRLTPDVLDRALDKLEVFWDMADRYKISPTSLAISFILSRKEISTTIPGIKTASQAIENSNYLSNLHSDDIKFLYEYYQSDLKDVVKLFKELG
ncbi:MAG: aldo/keto reductase [Ignavibacteria bacterium]|nr:aldo/keto reductase [Ignavibacteria bacterium]